MAASDLQNMKVAKAGEAPRTAGDNLANFDGEGHVDLEVVNAQLAADAGVKHAAFIDYDEALATHARRDDIEDLAHKNARDMPATFAEAAFMRRTDTSQWDNELVSDDVNTNPTPNYAAGENSGVYEQVGGDIDSDSNPATPAGSDEAISNE